MPCYHLDLSVSSLISCNFIGAPTRHVYFRGNLDKEGLEPLLLQTALSFLPPSSQIETGTIEYYHASQGSISFEFRSSGGKKYINIQFILEELDFMEPKDIQVESFLTHKCSSIRKLAKGWLKR